MSMLQSPSLRGHETCRDLDFFLRRSNRKLSSAGQGLSNGAFCSLPRFFCCARRWNPVIAAAFHPCALRIYGFRRRNQLFITRVIANSVSKTLISRLGTAIFRQSRVEFHMSHRFMGCFSFRCFDFAVEGKPMARRFLSHMRLLRSNAT